MHIQPSCVINALPGMDINHHQGTTRGALQLSQVATHKADQLCKLLVTPASTHTRMQATGNDALSALLLPCSMGCSGKCLDPCSLQRASIAAACDIQRGVIPARSNAMHGGVQHTSVHTAISPLLPRSGWPL